MIDLRGGLASAALALGSALERGARLAAYTAVGVMRLADVRAAIASEWREFGARQSAEEIAGGLFGWEERFYSRVLAPGARVLVIGCGAGRDLIALVKLGYRADGLESVPDLADAARGNLVLQGCDAPVTTGAVETVELRGTYDAFVFSWFCYSYIPRSAIRVAVLAKLRRHLDERGRILVTFIPGDGHVGLALRVCRAVGALTASDWRAEPGDTFVALGGKLANYQHRFAPGEIGREAAPAGLRLLCEERDQEGMAVLAPAP